MTGRFSENLYALEYEQLLVRLHAAMGCGDEAEADRLRDDMDRPARELKGWEQARLNSLSADLYMLQGDEVYEGTELSPEQLRRAIAEAHTQGNDAELLALLRQGDAGLPPDQIAFLRASAYGRLGHPLPSLLFLQYAAGLNSANIVYRYLALERLYDLRRFDEALEESRALAARADVPPVKRLVIAALMYQCTQYLPPEEARLVLGQARRILEGVLQQPQLLERVSRMDTAYGFAALGLCLEGLGRRSKALQAYDQALGYDPDSDAARVRRGYLHQQTDPVAAAADFKRAVDNGTDSTLPYLFLARQALLAGDNGQARDLSQALLSRTENPRALAAAWEFIAIARSRLGATPDVVEQAFQRAIQWDPTNARIRENAQAFQQSIREVWDQTAAALRFHPEDIPLPAMTPQESDLPRLALAA